jgi:signal transduction histidine kinase
VSIEHLLRDAAAELTPECAERQVRLAVDAAVDLPMLKGDGARLRLVFLNLMENAVKFNEPGGAVVVTAKTHDARLEVQVVNSHGTVPPERVQRLLQPFTQGDMGPSRRAGGLGLGLAVARAIVQAHGGELRLETDGGHGTSVRVRLPVAGPVQYKTENRQ